MLNSRTSSIEKKFENRWFHMWNINGILNPYSYEVSLSPYLRGKSQAQQYKDATLIINYSDSNINKPLWKRILCSILREVSTRFFLDDSPFFYNTFSSPYLIHFTSDCTHARAYIFILIRPSGITNGERKIRYDLCRTLVSTFCQCYVKNPRLIWLLNHILRMLLT